MHTDPVVDAPGTANGGALNPRLALIKVELRVLGSFADLDKRQGKTDCFGDAAAAE